MFLDHPNTVGENYGQHFIQAVRFAGKLLRASVVCFIHGIFPSLFVKTGSTIIGDLHDRMIVNRASQTHGNRYSKETDKVTWGEGYNEYII
jgi:hypothetical protein